MFRGSIIFSILLACSALVTAQTVVSYTVITPTAPIGTTLSTTSNTDFFFASTITWSASCGGIASLVNISWANTSTTASTPSPSGVNVTSAANLMSFNATFDFFGAKKLTYAEDGSELLARLRCGSNDGYISVGYISFRMTHDDNLPIPSAQAVNSTITSLTVSINGTNLPTTTAFQQGLAFVTAVWERTPGVACLPTPTYTASTLTNGTRLTLSFVPSSFSSSNLDGCLLRIRSIRKYNHSIDLSSQDQPIALFVKNNLVITPSQPRDGIQPITWPKYNKIRITGAGLPLAGEALNVTFTSTAGLAIHGLPASGNECNFPSYSSDGTWLDCNVSVSYFPNAASAYSTIKASIRRQNFGIPSAYTTVAMITSVSVAIPQQSPMPDVVYPDPIRFSFGSSYASLVEPTNSSYFVFPSCPGWNFACNSSTIVNKTISCVPTNSTGQEDCLVSAQVNWVGQPGSVQNVSRLFKAAPQISSVSSYLMFEASSAQLQILGQNLWSPNLPQVSVWLNDTTTCIVHKATSNEILCNTSMAMQNHNKILNVGLARYSLRVDVANAVRALFPPRMNLGIEGRYPFARASSSPPPIYILGEFLCPRENMTMEIRYGPASTPMTGGSACGSHLIQIQDFGIDSNGKLFVTPVDIVEDPNCDIQAKLTCYGQLSSESTIAEVHYAVPQVLPGAGGPVAWLAGESFGGISLQVVDFENSNYGGLFKANVTISYSENLETREIFACAVQTGFAGPRTTGLSCISTAVVPTVASDVALNLQLKEVAPGAPEWSVSSSVSWGVIIPPVSIVTQDVIDITDQSTSLLTVLGTGFPLGSFTSGSVVVKLDAVSNDTGLPCDSSTFSALQPSEITAFNSTHQQFSLTLTNIPDSFDFCTIRINVTRFGRRLGVHTVGTAVIAPAIAESLKGVVYNPTDTPSASFEVTGKFLQVREGYSVSVSSSSTPSRCNNLVLQHSVASSSFGSMSLFVMLATSQSQFGLTPPDGCPLFIQLHRPISNIASNPIQVGTVVVKATVAGATGSVIANTPSFVNITGQLLGSTLIENNTWISFIPDNACAATGPVVVFANITSASRSWQAAFFAMPSNLDPGSTCAINLHIYKYNMLVGSTSIAASAHQKTTSQATIYLTLLGSRALVQADLDAIQALFATLLRISISNVQVSIVTSAKRADVSSSVQVTLSGDYAGVTASLFESDPTIRQMVYQQVLSTLPAGFAVSSLSAVLPPPPPEQAPLEAVAPQTESSGTSGTVSPAAIAVPIVLVILIIVAVAIVIVVLKRKRQEAARKQAQSAEMQEKEEEESSSQSKGTSVKSNSNYTNISSTQTPTSNTKTDSDKNSKESSSAPSQTSSGMSSGDSGKPLKPEIMLAPGSPSAQDTTMLEKMMAKEFDQKWFIPFESIQFLKTLGRGAYGQVHKAKWDGVVVAVKQTLALQVDHAAVEEFKHEAKLLLNLQPHPNVVQVFGISIHEGNLFLIMEFCPFGSLDKYMKKEKLSVSAKVRILADCARGLAHLHASGIVHRDIATRNILLGTGVVPKISDFGMSRTIVGQVKEGVTASSIGPVKWMAPESLAKRVYSSQSDTYTFAVLISELFTEQMPFPNLDMLEAATAIRNDGLVPDLPDEVPKEVVELANECWSRDVESRPSMKSVASRLGEVADRLENEGNSS